MVAYCLPALSEQCSVKFGSNEMILIQENESEYVQNLTYPNCLTCQNSAFSRCAYIEYISKKLCSNPPARLLVLLAIGQWVKLSPDVVCEMVTILFMSQCVISMKA